MLEEGPWKSLYEAEDGTISGKAKVQGKSSKYACSGTGQILFKAAGDCVTMSVEVPEEGFYKVDTVYGAATGNSTGNTANNNPKNAKAVFCLDGMEKWDMVLQNTLSWYMSGMHTGYQYMRKGKHEITIRADKADGLASIDCLYLTWVGKEGTDVNKRKYEKKQEAELSDFNVLGEQTSSMVTTETKRKGYSGSGYVEGLTTAVSEGGGIRFYSCVNENGIYGIKVRYASDDKGSIGCYLGNTALSLDNKLKDIVVENTEGEWEETIIYAYLQQGMNILDFDASKETIALDSVTVSKKESGTNTTSIEAEDCQLEGDTKVKENTYASGGKYVAGIPADSKKKNCLKIKYQAKEAGIYQMTVYQSNAELFGNHSYNAQMVDRYVTMEVNGGKPHCVYFRNSYSDESFRTKVISLELKEGENEILIYNDDSRTLKNGLGGINTCENYTPNLDKFEITKRLVEVATLADPEVPEKDLSTPIPTAVPAATPADTPKATNKTEPGVTASSTAKGLKKGQKIVKGGITYQVVNASRKEVSAVKAKKKKKTVIPATVKINGTKYKVTEIKNNIFAANKKIKSVTIGKNVVKIGKKAFSGIPEKSVLKLPKGKKKIYKKMFAKAGLKKAVLK